ncbi:MAG TPA: hypothetical protein VGW38_01240 [Chloroflexota bacterium]|nr:hypothetical protein [Chloroflexota bacterium]
MLVQKFALDHLVHQERPAVPTPDARPDNHRLMPSSGGQRGRSQRPPSVNWLWTVWLFLASLFLFLLAHPSLR